MYALYLDRSPGLFLIFLAVYAVLLIISLKKRQSFMSLFVFSLFFLYVYLLFAVVFLPFPLNGEAIKDIRIIHRGSPILNVVPFHSVCEILSHMKGEEAAEQLIRQVGGNILLFMPFGFFLPFLWRRVRKLGYLFLVSLIVSLFIEVFQLMVSFVIGVCYRYADIDDIICNVIGSIAGYALYRLFLFVCRRVFRNDFLKLCDTKKDLPASGRGK